MPTQNVQIATLPFIYASAAPLTWLSTTTLTLPAQQVRDSTDAYDIVISAPLTLSTAYNAANGLVNGLDVGTIAASTWYYVWAIGDSRNYNAGASLISLSSTTPTLPKGYDVFRLRGAVLTDGSSHLLQFWTWGQNAAFNLLWDSTIAAVTGGVATAFATVSVAAGVPPIDATMALMDVSLIGNSAGNAVTFRVTGSSATTNQRAISTVATTVAQLAEISLLTKLATGNASIDYKVTSASDTFNLRVAGFSLST